MINLEVKNTIKKAKHIKITIAMIINIDKKLNINKVTDTIIIPKININRPTIYMKINIYIISFYLYF